MYFGVVEARTNPKNRFGAGGKVMDFEDATKLVPSGCTLTVAGIAQCQVPETMLAMLEARFLTTGEPKGITLAYPLMVGAGPNNGVEHLAYEGLVSRLIGVNYYADLYPKMSKLVRENKVTAYSLPLGSYLHLFREISRGSAGYLTQAGLDTWADPRMGGGKVNSLTKEDLVEVVSIGGQEYLFYRSFPIDVAIIRGTTADEDGNISMEEEPLTLCGRLYALAAKANRGKVIAQVKRVVKAGSIPAHMVQVPGVLVDAIVVDENQSQLENTTRTDLSLAGQLRMPVPQIPALPLGYEKIMCRRAMLEMKRGWIINLGARIPIHFIPITMLEENIQDLVHISIEHGALGGTCIGSHVHYNPTSFLNSDQIFDFYLGGGLDAAFLAGAEVDSLGNINGGIVGKDVYGAGGSVDICHNVPRVYFLTRFSTGGLEVVIENGKARIAKEGKKLRFVKNLEQMTINAQNRLKRGQEVKYITDRGVLRLEPRGLVLEEVAPGIDVKREILDRAEFTIFVDNNVKEMDPRIFREEPMGLRAQLLNETEKT